MDFEKDIFIRFIPDYDKLIKYGFLKENEIYKYKTKINNDLEIRIDIFNDSVRGKIFDLVFGEEYTNYRVTEQNGSFVSEVRERFINILKDIRDKCFYQRPFISDQANRISDLIYNKYKCRPIFKWDNYNYGVFENNNKWFALIADIDKNKISNLKGKVDVINIKLNNNKIKNLLNKKGFYEAYHMNKKNWITITLDDTISDDILMKLIAESYSYTVGFKGSANEWVMPINPGYFDVFAYFDENDTYYWDKKNSFKKGDVIYLYITKPIGAIMYKCVVKDFVDDFMIVKRIRKYEKGKYDLQILKRYGLTSVRSTRHIPFDLSEFLKKADDN